ncbi:MAG: DUF3078 domain-containing protein [Cyclobacteriaceae bacterium]
MKHFLVSTLFIFSLATLSWAQVATTPHLTDPTDTVAADTIWKTKFDVGLNFNQAAFSDNWTGGGVNSVAFSSFLIYQTSYKRGPWSWDNLVDLLYGVVNNSGEEFRKSQDRLLLDSKVGYEISKNWNAYSSVNFLTQFAPGFRYEETANGGEEAFKISDFMAPAFLTFSFGAEYAPNDNFTLRLSPFSPRFTFVTDTTLYLNTVDNTNYGVPIGETVRAEWLAAQLIAAWNKDITETINLQTRYLLFANFETFNGEEIDHRLDLTLVAKLTEYINVNFSAIGIYDFDQSENIQFSKLLGVGIALSKKGAVVK